MRRSVYRKLTTYLLTDCQTAVSEFAASHHNRDVYAFVLACDPFHGAVTICINTESALERLLRQPPEATRTQIDRLHGLRFRWEDFAFDDFGLSEDTMQLLDEIAAAQHDAKTDRTAERHANLLLLTLTRVVMILEPDLARLDMTSNFVAFVAEANASEKSLTALMRRTISEELFDRVFPEVRAFEEKLEGISKLSAPQQAKYWVEACRDFVCGEDNEDTRRRRETDTSREAMMDIVVQLGSAAVGPLLDAVQLAASEPQLQDRRSKACRDAAPMTPASVFAIASIDAIRAIGLVDEDNVRRIQELLRELHSPDQNKKADPVARHLAWLLHELRPHVYPEPKVDPKTNTLRNAAAFRLH